MFTVGLLRREVREKESTSKPLEKSSQWAYLKTHIIRAD